MSLLEQYLTITQAWRSVFPQQRTFQRAVRQALVRLAGLLGTALPDAHYLDRRRAEPQLECRVFSPLALPLGTAAVVPADSGRCPGILSAASGRVALDDTRIQILAPLDFQINDQALVKAAAA